MTFDARGNYVEPHTARRVPLGTLQVRSYLARDRRHPAPSSKPQFRLSTEFPTVGPRHRFGAVLFIEKEGFGPLLEAARIADALRHRRSCSTKGMSVVAARRLVEEVCAPHDIPLLVLHDFDVSGFTILGTLRESTRRHRFTRGFRVIDLGLRLSDVADLEPEAVPFKANADLDAIGYTLLKYGASEAEIEFLLKGRQRVELNALTSPQFVQFLERKLAEHGIRKVVPDADTLRLAALRAARIAKVQACDRRDERGQRRRGRGRHSRGHRGAGAQGARATARRAAGTTRWSRSCGDG